MKPALKPDERKSRKRVITRLLDDGDRYPWAVFVDSKIAHRDFNRASAYGWAERERTRLTRTDDE